MQAIEELKKEYLHRDADDLIFDLIGKKNLLPFRVICTAPHGERIAMSIIAKSAADAAIRAIDMLYGEDEMLSPRGLSITVKSIYTEG